LLLLKLGRSKLHIPLTDRKSTGTQIQVGVQEAVPVPVPVPAGYGPSKNFDVPAKSLA